MKKLVFLFLFFTNALFSYSIYIVNDTPFELEAIIKSANGLVLGKEILKPGEQSHWSTDMIRTDLQDLYSEDVSITPFTVIFKCQHKGFFSFCSNVSPGSTIKASACAGSKECSPPPEKENKSLINPQN